MLDIHFGENLEIIRRFDDESFDLIYIDPPFNTGRTQSRTRVRTIRDDNGDRTGFQGKRYRTTQLGSKAFEDSFEDYLAFLEPRLLESHRLLKPTGSFFFHIDYREVHYCKILLDEIFGRDGFLNEIIWSYDYGGRSKKRWSPKHDNILWYAKDPGNYTYRYDEIDRIPYMAPDLVGPEKARPPPTHGGTRSSAPTARRRRAIPPRSRSRSSTGSWRCIPIRVTGYLITSRAAGRPARPRCERAGMRCWSMTIPRPSR